MAEDFTWAEGATGNVWIVFCFVLFSISWVIHVTKWFAVRAANYILSASKYRNKRIITQQLTWSRVQLNQLICNGCAIIIITVRFIYFSLRLVFTLSAYDSLQFISCCSFELPFFDCQGYNYKSKIDWNHDICWMITTFEQTHSLGRIGNELKKEK